MAVGRITKEELLEKLNKKEDVIIIDVRNPDAFAGSPVKIPGAIRMGLDEIEKRCGSLDAKKEAITYCT